MAGYLTKERLIIIPGRGQATNFKFGR